MCFIFIYPGIFLCFVLRFVYEQIVELIFSARAWKTRSAQPLVGSVYMRVGVRGGVLAAWRIIGSTGSTEQTGPAVAW